MKAEFIVSVDGVWYENNKKASPMMAEKRLRHAAKEAFEYLANSVKVKRYMPDIMPASHRAVLTAAEAILSVALDEARGRVHICDANDDDIKAKTLSEEMQALYAAVKSAKAPTQSQQ